MRNLFFISKLWTLAWAKWAPIEHGEYHIPMRGDWERLGG